MVYTWAQERQLKFDEYRDLSSRLLMWLRENTAVMLDRNFPSTLIEMKVGTIYTLKNVRLRKRKNIRLRKRDQFARAVFVSIVGGGSESTIDIEGMDSQYFDCKYSP